MLEGDDGMDVGSRMDKERKRRYSAGYDGPDAVREAVGLSDRQDSRQRLV